MRKVGTQKVDKLFLIEMVMSVLFFSVSSALIVRTFASASEKMRENDLKNCMTMCAQNCAEVYSVSGSIDDVVVGVFGDEAVGKNEFLLDEQCRYDSSGDIILSLKETQRQEDEAGCLSIMTITFSSDKGADTLYCLECSAYVPTKGGNENA